ncbi:replication-associated recombination protein A [bacterium]|nr:MAG: replication-associated recombination protein A [bacterium]
MRPRSFDEYVGQRHLTGSDAAFRRAVESDRLGSVILWGPPGVGKTTLAEIVARVTKRRFVRISAVTAGVADLRKIVSEAKPKPSEGLFAAADADRGTVLFIDEIHRFNKAQQDAILPHVEDGTVTLIGATTENPSFEIVSALLSRSRTYVLNALEDEEIGEVIDGAVADPRGLGNRYTLEPDARAALVDISNGDARTALNALEATSSLAENVIDLTIVQSAIQGRTLFYDKGGDQHFDIISALHKSVRGSDPDASLYWLARMLESGEDPMYLARRIVRMATEDIGLADPHALTLCMAAQQAVHFIGMPEGALALAEAVVHLALAPKSNALYTAYKAATADVHQTRNDPVPVHLRNAPTKLMKNLGYGEGYRYAHNFEGGVVEQQNLPDRIKDRTYYEPTDRGHEAKLRARIDEIRRLRSEE